MAVPAFTALPGRDHFTCVSRDKEAIWGFDREIFRLHEELKEKGAATWQPRVNYYRVLEMHIGDSNGHVLWLGAEPDLHIPFVYWL